MYIYIYIHTTNTTQVMYVAKKNKKKQCKLTINARSHSGEVLVGGLFGNETLRKRKRVLRLCLVHGYLHMYVCMQHAGNCIIIIICSQSILTCTYIHTYGYTPKTSFVHQCLN